MTGRFTGLMLVALATLAAPLTASQSLREAIARAPKPLQCVPFARAITGIGIHGDAHTWWRQANGRFARGSEPKVGAVMNFRPHGKSRLGHVAAVSRIVDDRTVLISHANWSTRGGIERNVKAVDVSTANDWSQVRVWNGKANKLGGGEWPLYGFIYKGKPGKPDKAKRAKLVEVLNDEAPLARMQNADWPTAKPQRKKTAVKRDARPQPLPRRNDPIGAIIAGKR